MTKATHLTKHGIRQISECQNLASELSSTHMTLQLSEVTIFDPSAARKNIKARVNLSDGFSRITCMISDKIFQQIVSKCIPAQDLLTLYFLPSDNQRRRSRAVQCLEHHSRQTTSATGPESTVSDPTQSSERSTDLR